MVKSSMVVPLTTSFGMADMHSRIIQASRRIADRHPLIVLGFPDLSTREME